MASWNKEGSRSSLTELSRHWSSGKSEVQSRHTSGLLTYLMPFYLCPVLFPGTKESKCFYFVLLIMCWWMLRAMPKAIVAFVPAIVLPLLGIMGPEQVASCYLSADILTAALLLWLVLVGDETSAVRRLSYALVGRFGSRARPVLALLTASTFVASLVLPQSLVAVAVTCLAERICNLVRDEELQDPLRCLESAVADDDWTGRPSCEVDTLLLYEELAVALWKRHRAGLRDPDPEEHCGVQDMRVDVPGAKAAALRRKASILKHPMRIIGASSPRRVSSMMGNNDESTPSGPRFPNVPPDDQKPDSKRPMDHKLSGKLIRAKRRRQSFADKPHVFHRSERRHVPQDLPSHADETGSISSVSPWTPPPPRPDFTHQPPRIALGSPWFLAATAAPTVAGGAGPPRPLPRGRARVLSPTSPLPPIIPRPALTGVVARIGPAASSQDSVVKPFSHQAAHAPFRLQAKLEAPLRPVVPAVARVGAHIEGPVLPAPQPEVNGGRHLIGGRQPRILIRHQNQVVLPGRESPKRAGQFQRFRGQDRSFVTAMLTSFHSKHQDSEDEDPEERRLRRHQEVLAALCMCGSMTSVTGSIASYWFMPAAEAIAVMDSSSLSFWSWTLITLPVSLAASALSSVCVYYGSLHASDNQLNAQAERIVSCYAKLRLNRLEKYKIFELIILLFWLVYSGITIGCRFIQRQDLSTCFLGGIVLLASALPGSVNKPPKKPSPVQFRKNVDVDGDETPDFRPAEQGFASRANRLPWGTIIIYGAASVLTRVAESTGLAQVAFDNQFWSQQSDLVKQVLLTIASSLMAEFMTAAALCNTILPIVINLSTDTEHDALYFGLPVAVGASVNTILPVSLPLVMLHDMAPVTRKQLILTGAFVKTVVVASILVSMNTTGEYVLHSTRQFNSTVTLDTFTLR